MHRTRHSAVALAVGGLAAAVTIGVAAAPPTGAGGGDWIEPARDRYEAGQTVTMIGYGMSVPGVRERGPFYAWLRVDPVAVEAATARDPYLTIHPSDVLAGELVLEDVPGATDPYRAQRASISFDLPEDLADGAYPVVLCNDPCTDAPGYFIVDTIHVGIDPPYPIARDWPLTDPAVQWLEDDALLVLGDGRQVSAAEVRAGTVTEPAAPVMPGPAVAPQPRPQVAVTADPAGSGKPAGPPDAVGGATETGTTDRGDGGAAAWWVAAEAAALVVGGVAAMAWARRRRGRSAPRRPRVVVRTGEARAEPSGTPASDDGGAVDDGDGPAPNHGHEAVPIRL